MLPAREYQHRYHRGGHDERSRQRLGDRQRNTQAEDLHCDGIFIDQRI